MDDSIEKRVRPRVEVRWPISISTHQGTIKGETVNISVDGMSISCDEPLPLNETFNISIIPLNQQIIEVAGRVVWSDCYGINDDITFGIGVCFVKISDKDRHQFNNLVSAFLH